MSLHLRSTHIDWHTTFKCAIYSDINDTTLSTTLFKFTWKIPKKFNLAEQQFEQTGGFDLLIGAYLFYEIFRSAQVPILAIFHFKKRQILAGHSLGELQPPLHSMTRSIHLCSENITLSSTIYTAPGNLNPWSQPS